MSKCKNWIKFLIFSVIAVLLVTTLGLFLFIEVEGEEGYAGFYKQEENSLDLISIGNSTVYSGISPCEIWNESQITSYDISSGPTHPEVIIIAIDEVARTQNPQMVYIDLNGLTFQKKIDQNNFVINYVKSMPKGEARDALIEKYDYLKSALEKENKFEIFKNHNAFRNPDFSNKLLGKSNDYLKGFKVSTDVQRQHAIALDPDKTLPIQEEGVEYLERILETCKKYPNIKFVFGKTPRFLNSDIINANYELRSIIPTIESYGYSYVEWDKYIEEMGLDETQDARDQQHLNTYGATKFSKFFVNYLKTNFGLVSGQHSQSVVDDFNSAYQKYVKEVKSKL